jgi:hypothetical protein
MTTPAEPVAAMTAMETEHEKQMLHLDANRANVEASSARVLALAAVDVGRARLRHTFARSAVFVCVLAAAWSIFLMVRWA